MTSIFQRTFTAGQDDIDELGHVNNAVWVRWIQDMATAHWTAMSTPADNEAYVWVVVRHEIDYRASSRLGETVVAQTWVDPAGPKGARFDRYVEFSGQDGKTKVRAKTTWAIVDRMSGHVVRVPQYIADRFLQGSTE